jgi:hypothetical protein
MNGLGIHSRHKNSRDLYKGINSFKKGYQLRTNLVRDDNCDLLAHSHSILNRWKNDFSQQLKVYRASDVRQIEIHTPFVPEPSPFGTEIATGKLKNYKSSGNDQILALHVQVRAETLRSDIHKVLIIFGVRKNSLIIGRCTLLYHSTRTAAMITEEYQY